MMQVGIQATPEPKTLILDKLKKLVLRLNQKAMLRIADQQSSLNLLQRALKVIELSKELTKVDSDLTQPVRMLKH